MSFPKASETPILKLSYHRAELDQPSVRKPCQHLGVVLAHTIQWHFRGRTHSNRAALEPETQTWFGVETTSQVIPSVSQGSATEPRVLSSWLRAERAPLQGVRWCPANRTRRTGEARWGSGGRAPTAASPTQPAGAADPSAIGRPHTLAHQRALRSEGSDSRALCCQPQGPTSAVSSLWRPEFLPSVFKAPGLLCAFLPSSSVSPHSSAVTHSKCLRQAAVPTLCLVDLSRGEGRLNLIEYGSQTGSSRCGLIPVSAGLGGRAVWRRGHGCGAPSPHPHPGLPGFSAS